MFPGRTQRPDGRVDRNTAQFIDSVLSICHLVVSYLHHPVRLRMREVVFLQSAGVASQLHPKFACPCAEKASELYGKIKT